MRAFVKTSGNRAKTLKNGNPIPCPYKDGLVKHRDLH